jgi:PBP1b-binding outer membrane lipoprotein LpoB
MKTTLTLIFAALIAAVFISGCTQQTGTTGNGQQTTANQEQQAFQAIDQETNQALQNMSLQDVENELLVQG